MKLDQKGVGSATVLIVLTAVVSGTIGTPVLVDAADTQPDSSFYSLERLGESIKKPFLDKRTVNISLAEERWGEFSHMVSEGKSKEYMWIAEEPVSHYSKALSLSEDAEELDLAFKGLRKYSLKLENIKTEVPSEVETKLEDLQLRSFITVSEMENMSVKRIREMRKTELETRLQEIKVKTSKLVERKGPNLEFELSGTPKDLTLRTEDRSLALQIGKIQEDRRIKQIENLVLKIEKTSSENYYIEIDPSENVSIVWPEDNIRIESGPENIELKLPQKYPYVGRPENLEISVENLVDLGIGRPDNLSVEIIENEQEEDYKIIQPDNWEVIYLPENVPENKWVWTEKEWYHSGENVEIHFMNRGEEDLWHPNFYAPQWDIEKYKNGEWKDVQIYPPDTYWLMLLPPPLEPGEIVSGVWDQIVYEGTRENYTSEHAEPGRYRVVWSAEEYRSQETYRFTHEFEILEIEYREDITHLLKNHLKEKDVNVSSVDLVGSRHEKMLEVSFSSDTSAEKVEKSLREDLHVSKLAYTYLFENSTGNPKPLFEEELKNVAQIRVSSFDSEGKRICSISIRPNRLADESNELRDSLLNEKLFREHQGVEVTMGGIKYVLGPEGGKINPPENRMKGSELLVFLSPQYSGSSQIIEAINEYQTAVKNDLNWDSRIILLDDQSNGIGEIRKVIRKSYRSGGIYAAFVIGEDTETLLSADASGQETPSIVPWAVLNENFSLWWRESNKSVRIKVTPTVRPDQLDYFFKEHAGSMTSPHTPNVAVSLLYPTKTHSFTTKKDWIIDALSKFSENREMVYENDIHFFVNENTDSTAFVENCRGLGDVHYYTHPADSQKQSEIVASLYGEELKLLGAFGHGNTGWAHGLTAHDVNQIKTPFLAVSGCYTGGWRSNDLQGDNQFDPPASSDYWFGEQPLLHPTLRTVVAGVAMNFGSYGWKGLSRGQTIAESWLGTGLKKPPEIYIDGQIIYGDPTFHYSENVVEIIVTLED